LTFLVGAQYTGMSGESHPVSPLWGLSGPHAILLRMSVLLAILLAATATAQAPAEPEPFPYPPEQEKIGEDGYRELTTGDSAKAEAAFRKLTDQLAPENPRAWRLLGFALLQQSKAQEAIAALDRAE